MYKILRLFSVAAVDSIVVVAIGNYQEGPSSILVCGQFSILIFIIFMFSSSGCIKFMILVEDSDNAYCL